MAFSGVPVSITGMTALVQDSTSPVRPLFRLPSLTLRLLWRFWPQLMALWLLGVIGNAVLNEIAVMLGRLNGIAGLSMLAFVVLLKLVIIVALFQTVRPGLPALDAASRTAEARPERAKGSDSGASGFTSALALTLLPFFAYYTAWGLLGDTIREYSKLSFDLTMFGEDANILEFSTSTWLIASVAIAWAVRRFAKAMHKRSKSPVWPLVIVVCDANWAFIGLYVISSWEDEIRAWVAHLPEAIGQLFAALDPIGNAIAATGFPPTAEAASISTYDQIRNLFFYVVYPAVWLTLAAIIYGYDINGERPMTEGRIARIVSRWDGLPSFIRDFIAHFIAGTARRYRALAEGIGLAIGSGLALALSVIVLYRVLDWAAAWAWYGTANLIGPHDLHTWQIISQGISLFLGSPSAPGDVGVLVVPVKICLLAAALEIGFAQGREWRRSAS